VNRAQQEEPEQPDNSSMEQQLAHAMIKTEELQKRNAAPEKLAFHVQQAGAAYSRESNAHSGYSMPEPRSHDFSGLIHHYCDFLGNYGYPGRAQMESAIGRFVTVAVEHGASFKLDGYIDFWIAGKIKMTMRA
jgi:hypothetical protein